MSLLVRVDPQSSAVALPNESNTINDSNGTCKEPCNMNALMLELLMN